MGEDGGRSRFRHPKADGRCGVSIWRSIGWLPPFEGFLNLTNGQFSGKIIDHRAYGQQYVTRGFGHGVICGLRIGAGGRNGHKKQDTRKAGICNQTLVLLGLRAIAEGGRLWRNRLRRDIS